MFTKGEMILAIAVSLFGGFAIGYSKAREIFVSALAKAVFEDEIKNQEEKTWALMGSSLFIFAKNT